MPKRQMDKARVLICLAGVFAYAFVYHEYLRKPLFDLIRDLPTPIRNVLIVFSLLPLLILGGFSVVYYLRDSKSDGVENQHAPE
jgi:hypothetical protein